MLFYFFNTGDLIKGLKFGRSEAQTRENDSTNRISRSI